VLRSERNDGFGPLIERMMDVGKVLTLDGNVAVLGADGALRTLDVADKRQWGALPFTSRSRVFIRTHWWALGFAVIGGALVFAAFVRLWALRRGGRA
jgi:hypothetical protein